MKNKWRFFAVIMAVVLCMTVFSVTAYAGGDMVDSTMGDPTMETPTATTQPENTNTGEQTPNGQTLTVLVTENADGSHTVTIGDRSWTLPAKREQSGKVVNVRTYLNLRTGPGTDYTVVGRLLNGAEVKVLEESNGWYKVVVPEQTGYVCGKYLEIMDFPKENSGNDCGYGGAAGNSAEILHCFQKFFISAPDPGRQPDAHGRYRLRFRRRQAVHHRDDQGRQYLLSHHRPGR